MSHNPASLPCCASLSAYRQAFAKRQHAAQSALPRWVEDQPSLQVGSRTSCSKAVAISGQPIGWGGTSPALPGAMNETALLVDCRHCSEMAAGWEPPAIRTAN